MSPSKKKSVPSYPKVIETYQPPRLGTDALRVA